MAVRKQGKNWVIDYYAGGRRYVRVVGPHKRDAIAAEGKIRALIREQRFFELKPRVADVTLHELIERYIEHSAAKRSLQTELIHLGAIRGHFGPRRPLGEINRADVDAFRLARQRTPTRNGKPRAAATVNRELSALHRLLNKAIEWGMMEHNPAHGVKSLPEPRGRVRFLSVEEAGRLLDACAAHLRPIVLCALETGMRRGEILGLRWEDLDLERRILYVGKTKTGIPRYVPMSSRLLEMLAGITRRPGCDHVFCGDGKAGKPGKPFRYVRHSFGNACRKAGITGFRFHDIRHTAASHLVMAGVSLKVVGTILGHTTTAMTERYSHLTPDHLIRAVETLPDWTKGEGTGCGNARGQVVPLIRPVD